MKTIILSLISITSYTNAQYPYPPVVGPNAPIAVPAVPGVAVPVIPAPQPAIPQNNPWPNGVAPGNPGFGQPQPGLPQPGVPAPPQPGLPVNPNLPTRPPVMGHFGQDCTPAQGDFPAACPKVGESNLSFQGKIECIHNFDCCTCGAMICGTPATPDCGDIICNGDSSCYGVRNIQISGNTAGASLNCNGDLSCMETTVIGTNVASILCSGDGSCAYSSMHVGCIAEGCTLECVGDNSCEADPLNPRKAAEFILVNSMGIVCASHACRYGKYNLMTNLGGSVICGAQRACVEAEITINNIASVTCGGMYACQNAKMLIVNPQKDFSITCQSAYSCAGASIEIIVTKPEITSFRSISLNGPSSGEGMTVSITKMLPPGTTVTAPGSEDLFINELVCGAAKACKNAVFDMTPNVVFNQCGCAGGMTQACDGLLGVDSCTQGLLKMECVGATGCANMIESITNPADGFELICADAGACQNFILTININDGAKAPTRLGGVTCGSPSACKGLRVFVLNTNPRIRVSVGMISCGASQSCMNAAFVLRQADIQSIQCGVGDSCQSCSWFTDNVYQPCQKSATV